MILGRLPFIYSLEKVLNTKLYLVGGAVRDLLLNTPIKDFDFTCPLSPDEIEKRITSIGKKAYTVGKKFGTIGFNFESIFVEVTTFREEQYSKDSRKPAIKFVEDLKEDLSRRDFTINALAMDSSGKIYDYFGGQKDIEDGVLRAIGNVEKRFSQDPLRMLRAARFASEYNLSIEQKTKETILEKYYLLVNISKERWVEELDKILASDNVLAGMDLLMDLRIFNVICPELTLQKDFYQSNPFHDFTLWENTKKVVATIPKQDLDLRWAALLYNIAKPFTRTKNKKECSNYVAHNLVGSDMAMRLCKHLKFSNKRIDFIVSTIKDSSVLFTTIC